MDARTGQHPVPGCSSWVGRGSGGATWARGRPSCCRLAQPSAAITDRTFIPAPSPRATLDSVLFHGQLAKDGGEGMVQRKPQLAFPIPPRYFWLTVTSWVDRTEMQVPLEGIGALSGLGGPGRATCRQ